MDQTLSRRERKKVQTRQRLLEAALSLFREKGFSASTVEEIANKADVAKGTFFNYFPSKEALLHELAILRVGQLSAALDVNRGAPSSPVARITLLMRLLQEQAIPHKRLARRAFAMHLRAPPPPPDEARHQIFGLLTNLVSEAQACGDIRADLDVEVVSDLLRMSFFWHIARCNFDDNNSVPTGHEHVIDLLMDGLAGPAWRRQQDRQPRDLDT